MSDAYPTPSWDSILGSTFGYALSLDGQHVPGTAGFPTIIETIIDFTFPEERELQGWDISAWNGSPGDRVSVGIFAPSPLVEVQRVATRVALPPSKTYSVIVQYSLSLVAGLIVRFTYESVGALAPEISVNLRTWLPASA